MANTIMLDRVFDKRIGEDGGRSSHLELKEFHVLEDDEFSKKKLIHDLEEALNDEDTELPEWFRIKDRVESFGWHLEWITTYADETGEEFIIIKE